MSDNISSSPDVTIPAATILIVLAAIRRNIEEGEWQHHDIDHFRSLAKTAGIDADIVTPYNLICRYRNDHNWRDSSIKTSDKASFKLKVKICRNCQRIEDVDGNCLTD